jgi:hypothetical protein
VHIPGPDNVPAGKINAAMSLVYDAMLQQAAGAPEAEATGAQYAQLTMAILNAGGLTWGNCSINCRASQPCLLGRRDLLPPVAGSVPRSPLPLLQ